jgi:hypothetical protein
VADRHFTFAYTFAKERRIGYRKGPGRAGGKLTRSILLNRSTIPKKEGEWKWKWKSESVAVVRMSESVAVVRMRANDARCSESEIVSENV